MKTLDEVIKAQERCGTYPNCHFCFLHSGPMCEWIRDALQWLKGYKAHIELDRLRDKCEAKNDPLTWEELKSMEGKPVWVEDDFYKKGEWLLIQMVEGNDIWYVDRWAQKDKFYRDNFGRLWQAYRKER